MSLILYYILLALILIPFVHSKWRLYRVGSSLPGPWAIPLLGNAQMIGKLKPEFIFLVFTELRERFGATYRLWIGPQLWVFLDTAEETRAALYDSTLRKASTFMQLEPLIGNGLLISHGPKWATHRRLLVPAFQPQILRSFGPAVGKHADRLVDILLNTQGAPIEVTDYMFSCLLDAIVDTSMGRQLNTQSEANSQYTAAFHKTSELLFKRMINPLLISDFIFKRTELWRKLQEQLNIIHTLMESIICNRAEDLQRNEQQQQMENNFGKRPRTLLDTLLQARIDGQPLTMQEIRDEVNTFVFAGVDTTTASMSFVLYALAKYPFAQLQLYDELEGLTVNALDDMDALNQLPYLDMLIKEVLRFYTIVPTTGRQTTCDTRIGDHTFCAGVTLWINMYGLAHDQRYFPQPFEFVPERWANSAAAPPFYSYIPFSGGPHVCIGRKYSLLLIKLLTVRIVRNFHLVLRDAEEQIVLQAQMVLKARDGLHVKFIQR